MEGSVYNDVPASAQELAFLILLYDSNTGDLLSLVQGERIALLDQVLRGPAPSAPLRGFHTATWRTSFRAGTRFLILLYDSNTGDLLSLVQGARCSLLRTSAVSAVATRHMARKDSATVGIIGTGFQGRGQLEGVCAVRNIESVKAYDRFPEAAAKFCNEMSAKLGIEVSQADSAEECARGSDIVITMTTTRRPVLLGEWLEPGMHVNAAGSNHWIRQEVDDDVIRRSDRIVVDSIEDAKIEAGDLLYPIERGRVRWDQIHDLASVVAGRVSGRDSDEEITLFESQGIAVSDVAAAAYVYRKASEAGLGVEVPLEL